MLISVCFLSVIVVAVAADTCYTGIGKEYSGNVSTTASGRTCQRWDTKSPHSHKYGRYHNLYPEGSSTEAANYCRNPTTPGFSKGLWCYTTDPSKRWELCGVPTCKVEVEELGCWGDKWNRAISGKSIQVAADADGVRLCAEHAQSQGFTVFAVQYNTYCFTSADAGKTFKKYGASTGCVGGRGGGMANSVYRIKAGDTTTTTTTSTTTTTTTTTTPAPTTPPPTTTPAPTTQPPTTTAKPDTCYTGTGEEYSGRVSTTSSGKTCQRWDTTSPHSHWYSRSASKYPDSSVAEASNYCRNPSKYDDGLWCYTTDASTRWELCDIPECGAYVDMGCWRNKVPQKLDNLEGTDERLDNLNYKNRDDAINKCSSVANGAGYDFFAVGNKGQCWAGHGDIYKHYGQPRKCPAGGLGKYGIVHVYAINK